MLPVEDRIRALAADYARTLQRQIADRIKEMDGDDTSHFVIYKVLGVSDDEGRLIDVYQNKGRFLYKYAGAFLETAARMCFEAKHGTANSLRIPNTHGTRPKTFEIDCVIGNHALEIKWRDATTDGDHISKEDTRLRVIKDAGYHPIRIMFYYPNRAQAIKIQKTLEALYKEVGGRYFYGDAAWKYIHEETGVDLHGIMRRLASKHAFPK